MFNIPLFTGWEQALAKKIPMSWWKRVTFQALIRFNKWLYPRPELFKWLNVGLLCLVLLLAEGSSRSMKDLYCSSLLVQSMNWTCQNITEQHAAKVWTYHYSPSMEHPFRVSQAALSILLLCRSMECQCWCTS